MSSCHRTDIQPDILSLKILLLFMMHIKLMKSNSRLNRTMDLSCFMNTGCKLIVKNKVKANMILHSYSGYLFEGRICDGIFLCADSNELIFVRVYELEDQINSSKVLYSFRSLDNLRVADKFMAIFLLRILHNMIPPLYHRRNISNLTTPRCIRILTIRNSSSLEIYQKKFYPRL